ncbi:hypothetical protein [Desulfovibrio sp.]|uniref:hypothetical protein n=1 Tax=Desulfovibrio sp. TaxID=885 RepID=UPI003FF0A843
MNTYAPTLDAVLETEEFITAEEYMCRRERGEINPADVRYVPTYPGSQFGGFMVKLKRPRYKVNVKQDKPVEDCYGW